jgi:hypothetical protein
MAFLMVFSLVSGRGVSRKTRPESRRLQGIGGWTCKERGADPAARTCE